MRFFLHMLTAGMVATCCGTTQANLLLQIDTIEGDSRQQGHENWIEISSFQVRVTNVAEDGQSRSTPEISPLAIQAPSSSASPELFSGVLEGRTYSTAELHLRPPAGTGGLHPIASWKLDEVRVTSFETRAEPDGQGGTVATDFFDLQAFDTITYSYNSFDDKGTKTGTVTSSWDIAENKKTLVTSGTVDDFQFLTSCEGSCDSLTAEPGDFDGDGMVDGRDFLAWQRGISPNPLSAPELAEWQANYGNAAAAQGVPEPTTLGTLLMGFMALFIRDKRVQEMADT